MSQLISLLSLLIAWLYAQDAWRDLRAPLLRPAPAARSGPLVSVLIPARDEAARLAGCLDGLAQQTYARFEVIVVDDHSRDGTAGLARSYAGRLPQLAVLAGAPLPPGWAGKCWACWQAAARAQGEWLLFLDADVLPAPGLLAALVARAEAHGPGLENVQTSRHGARASADARARKPSVRVHPRASAPHEPNTEHILGLLTLLPLQRLGSWAERLVLPAFFALLTSLYPLHRVSDPHTPLAFANGPCLLIRRAVYFATDGHRAVRASILEDAELGQRVKAAGYAIEAAHAPDLIAVRMYAGWPSLREGLAKNAVAGYRSGGARSAWVGLRQALLAFGPGYMLAAGALAGPALRAALLAHGAALLLLALASWGWLARRRYRQPAWQGALLPLGTAIYFGLAAWGLLRLRSGRGVLWKGRRYG